MIRSCKWKPTKKKLQRSVRPEGEHRRCWATSRGKLTRRVVEGMKMEKKERKEWKKERKEGWFYSLPQPSSSSVEDGKVGGGRTARASSPATPSCSRTQLAAASDPRWDVRRHGVTPHVSGDSRVTYVLLMVVFIRHHAMPFDGCIFTKLPDFYDKFQ